MAFSTTTTPTTIEVVIRKGEDHHGDEAWAVEPKDDKANEDRVKHHKKHIKGKWKKRHGKFSLDLDDHRPIVFLEGETLEFRCQGAVQFAIGVKKNPDVEEFPGAPDNPFGWSGLQIGTSTSPVSAVVITTADVPGPKYQAFYKFHGWVRLEDGTFEAVDPDGYCGS